MRNFVLAVLLLWTTGLLKAQGDFDFEVSKNLDIYSDVYKQLVLHYVDDISPGELNKAAIDALLRHLDPYTVYYPESKIEDVRYLRTGRYGGVGASIRIENDTFVVGNVLPGYPFDKSGIIAGDQLLSIDEQALSGLPMEALSAMLKGQVGSSFRLRYRRAADGAVKESSITREEIKINSVAYYGTVDRGIGYLRLKQFNETASEEVKQALAALSGKEELKGLIIDLRNNGGGLLQEAVEIMDLFLPPGKMIVETRGKIAKENQKYYTSQAALYGRLPVVVLVNKNSASASEIVAGSFQDLDRGIIMGQKSFGKGLVQRVYPLSYNAQMKITVAKYYIASGRCIQAINYSEHDADGHAVHIADTLRHQFKTENNRAVKDAGGIVPDVSTKAMSWPDIALQLNKQNLIFDYATRYALQHDSIAAPATFSIDDDEYRRFIQYAQGKGFDYKTREEVLLEQLLQSETVSDSLRRSFEAALLSLQKSKQQLYKKYAPEIKLLLRQEIVSRYYYETGRSQSILRNDEEVKQAAALLNDRTQMLELLNGAK